jgi:hypothetical protein
VEGGRYQIEGPVQPTKTTRFAREESQNVGCDTQPAVVVLVSAGLRLETVVTILSYLHRRVNFVFICHDWLVARCPPLPSTSHSTFRSSSTKMSQTVKDLTAGTAGGIAQVKPLL